MLAQTYLGPGIDERLTSAVSATVVDKQINSPLGIAAYTRVTNGTPGTTTYLTRDPQGGLLGLRVGTGGGATHYYVQADNLGNILKVINSVGGVVASRTYDAYGTTTASTGTLLEPFGYTGAYTDMGAVQVIPVAGSLGAIAIGIVTMKGARTVPSQCPTWSAMAGVGLGVLGMLIFSGAVLVYLT